MAENRIFTVHFRKKTKISTFGERYGQFRAMESEAIEEEKTGQVDIPDTVESIADVVREDAAVDGNAEEKLVKGEEKFVKEEEKFVKEEEKLKKEEEKFVKGEEKLVKEEEKFVKEEEKFVKEEEKLVKEEEKLVKEEENLKKEEEKLEKKEAKNLEKKEDAFDEKEDVEGLEENGDGEVVLDLEENIEDKKEEVEGIEESVDDKKEGKRMEESVDDNKKEREVLEEKVDDGEEKIEGSEENVDDGEEKIEGSEENMDDGEEKIEGSEENVEDGEEKIEGMKELADDKDELVENLEELDINEAEKERDEEGKSEREDTPEPEILETAEEKQERIKEFYDIEFTRPDLDPQGPKTSYVIIKYENYQRPLESIQEKRETPKKRVEINEGNAKIAEYFGEDLNSDEELDQLLKQFTEIGTTEKIEGTYPAVGREQPQGDEISDISEGSIGRKAPAHNKEKAAFPTIVEENENQVIPESTSPTKHKEKSKADKRKKNNELVSSKVHIRHLPQNMRKEEFLEAIGPLPEYNYLHYTSGSFMSRVCNRKCTGFCHVNFVKQEDADAFVNSYRIFIIRDERGDECFGSAEFAINQRLPKIPSVITYDPRSLYDMPSDVKYKDFKQSYDANVTGILGVPVNQDGSVTADVMMNEIEERNTHKNELQTTPLLAYIMAQAKSEKEKKFGQSIKKASEKSRITIKKERKRDRRDRRDRKEKDKDKVKNTKDGDHKPEAKESSRQSDKKIKRNPDKNRKSDTSGTKPSEGAPKDKDSLQSESKQDSVEKKPNTGVARDKADSDTKKDRKITSPPKKYDKRNNEKRSSGAGKSDTRHTKSDMASSTSKVAKPEKPSADTVKTSNPEPSKAGNSNAPATSGIDQDRSGQKKKTVKKVVKVKKVMKKGEEISGTSTGVHEKKEASSANALSDAQHKNKSVEGNKADSGGAQQHDNGSGAQNETKRTKKARPDMQIYRPGSLRNKGTDSKAGAGDNTSKKEKDKSGEVKVASKEGKSSDKLKHGDS
ncbi:unnamed protein product [Allacma fusca]|uniref:UPF3 domain-containing protein n=1 Tax=Allacma fusca TaxID=39272 RepID=A0A8J2JAC7_9HEXA|nr:unnamed protein product [Allacma fusca]